MLSEIFHTVVSRTQPTEQNNRVVTLCYRNPKDRLTSVLLSRMLTSSAVLGLPQRSTSYVVSTFTASLTLFTPLQNSLLVSSGASSLTSPALAPANLPHNRLCLALTPPQSSTNTVCINVSSSRPCISFWKEPIRVLVTFAPARTSDSAQLRTWYSMNVVNSGAKLSL